MHAGKLALWCLPAALADTRIDFQELTRTGAIMGSGGLVVLDDREGSPQAPYRKSAGLIPNNGAIQVVAGHGGAGLAGEHAVARGAAVGGLVHRAVHVGGEGGAGDGGVGVARAVAVRADDCRRVLEVDATGAVGRARDRVERPGARVRSRAADVDRAVASALKASHDMRESVAIRPVLQSDDYQAGIVGRSEAMQSVFKLIGQLATSDATGEDRFAYSSFVQGDPPGLRMYVSTPLEVNGAVVGTNNPASRSCANRAFMLSTRIR